MPKELTDREARIRAYALGYLVRRGHLSNRSYDEAMEHGRAVMRLADRRAAGREVVQTLREVEDGADPEDRPRAA